MPSVLHLVKPGASPVAGETIRQQTAAGDRVTVVLLDGAALPSGASGLSVHRIPEELSYGQLLDLVFEADRVIAW